MALIELYVAINLAYLIPQVILNWIKTEFFFFISLVQIILATCSLLAAPLTLVIAIMELGLHNPEKTGITPEVSAKMIAAGIFASLLYPSLARRLLKGEDSSETRVLEPDVDTAHT